MKRLKYNPDGWVLINTDYNCTFDTFNAHCGVIGVENPFIKGEYASYTNDGLELINEKGIHSAADGGINATMDVVIAMVGVFVKEALKTEEAERLAFEESLPLKEKRRLAYLRQTPIEDQLEALMDYAQGDTTKFDKIKLIHDKIKTDIK